MDRLPYEPIPADGLVLRPPRGGDAGEVARAWADPLIGRYVPGLPNPVTTTDAERWIDDTLAEPYERGYVIAEPGTDRLLGVCRLYHLALDDQTGEVGYWVAPWERGRRVATRATMALTEWAFRHDLGRLEILARPDNPTSHRVALAAGYRWEGRRRGVEPDRGGHRHDLVAFARLATDLPGPAPRPLPDLPDGRLADGVVEVRPLGPEHALEVGRLRSLPDVVMHSVPPEPPAAGTIDQMCAEALGRWLAGERAEAAILDAATGALAGTIQLTGLEPPTGHAMIGYDLLPAWRGRGYTTRAVRLLARWAFDQAGLARLVAGAATDNTASQRVLERAGFVREGCERSRLPGPDGTRVDVIVYALLRDAAP